MKLDIFNFQRCFRIREERRSAKAAMAPTTISYITALELKRLQSTSKLAVIDVRDEERSYDGHIAGSWHFASDTFTDELPALAEKLDGHDVAVFHCAKSQVRGPSCAMRFVDHLSERVSNTGMKTAPHVYVLESGFNGWASAGHPVCQCGQSFCSKH
ncbi:hypothetical protein KP509_37G005600 [Ceratopteris richardii]|uniref:arsenate reductase (glutathione/glutaredoxin) n=1 Tax=Ceratopteris richardii TaxID=49495 RepID=A0A8T2Q640_CERRI|nr:hypothetical protein KP509_37G005600 [Ceratopteris richardii]